MSFSDNDFPKSRLHIQVKTVSLYINFYRDSRSKLVDRNTVIKILVLDAYSSRILKTTGKRILLFMGESKHSGQHTFFNT